MQHTTWYINDRAGAHFIGPKLRKRTKTMTPTNGTTNKTARVQNTVFDLAKFDDVTLYKVVELPSKPATLKDALEAAGNDESKLLDLIHEGLCAETKENARADMNGYKVVTDEGDGEELYSGSYADEEKGKLINAGILAIAKMNGYTKSLAPEKKAEIKDKAKKFLRENPAMLGGITGGAA
jgi:hypothetical protein